MSTGTRNSLTAKLGLAPTATGQVTHGFGPEQPPRRERLEDRVDVAAVAAWTAANEASRRAYRELPIAHHHARTELQR